MSQDKSDFMARLEAMRAGKQIEQKKMPSLKERLEAQSPAFRPNSGGASSSSASADAMRAKIQAKFRKAQEPEFEEIAEIDEIAPVVEQNSPPIDLKETKIPRSKPKSEEDELGAWTPEHGGSCPACDTFNMGHVVFCANCNYMLTKKELEVEIVSSYPLKEIPGVVHAFIDKLGKLNINTTEDMLRVGVSHSNRVKLAKQTGMSEKSLLKLVHQSNLCRIPSFEPDNAGLLDLMNMTTMDDLLAHKPGSLHKKIQQNKMKINRAGIMFLPTKSQLERWIKEAGQLTPIKIL